MPRHIRWVPLCVLLALLLSACDAGATGAVMSSTATTTAVPPLPTPTNVPAGWQVFAPPPAPVLRFSIAYPSGWTERFSSSSGSSTPGTYTSGAYTFASSDGSQSVVVYEGDGGNGASTQRDCADAHYTHVTYAGLPMLYTVDAGGSVRDYTFLTQQGVSYQLLSDAKALAATQAFYDSIFATFRPQYTTPACT